MTSASNIFQTRLNTVATEMEAVLTQILPEPAGPQSRIMEAMAYALLGGGKRLRPFLLIEAAKMLGADNKGIWQAAAALECVHVYSLIHDDLPCMDDDDLRHGKPTVHKAYDEALAVLAGDALLTLAFEILAQESVHSSANVRLKLISELASNSGTHGMIGGQVLDIYAKLSEQSEALITHLQALKTGALIHYSAVAGGRLAGATDADLGNLSTYADALGLAFQIRDDILDVEGDSNVMGKRTNKDAGLGKATFVSIYGLDGAKEKAHKLGEHAKNALRPYGKKADILCATVDFVLNRQK
ncbi:MAG: farnesyl-diphosphate synthase [Robiginitomaculum sp.]|nr:MAG: farnesyl-diphosphate synthase [Robiginitomaculum sp.]